jgi:membrane protein YqaA with SNARE-associated domain
VTGQATSAGPLRASIDADLLARTSRRGYRWPPPAERHRQEIERLSSTENPENYTFADGVKQPLTYKKLGPKVWVLGAIMVVTAIVTLFLILQDFSSNSYLYLLLYAIPANSAVSVFPHEPVVIYFGSNGNVWYTALAASIGTLIAGFLDHSVFVPVMNLQSLAGYKDKGWYQKIARLFMKYPFLVIMITGFTPIPFFPFKFLAFSVHYPLWKYLGALLTGRFPRYVMLAWLGSLFEIPTWALFAFFGVVIAIYAYKAVPKAVAYIKEARGRRTGGDDAGNE